MKHEDLEQALLITDFDKDLIGMVTRISIDIDPDVMIKYILCFTTRLLFSNTDAPLAETILKSGVELGKRYAKKDIEIRDLKEKEKKNAPNK